VFAASLDHLVSTPRLYGWTFAFRIEDTNIYPTTLEMCPRGDFGLTTVQGLGDVATVCNTSVQVEGHPVAGWGFAHVRGVIDPEIVQGRAPRSSDEVAVGDVTLRAIHKHVGDTVRISGGGRSANFRVVGQTVLPSLSSGSAQPLADGAAFTDTGQARVFDAKRATRYLLGRFARDGDNTAAEQRISTMSFGAPRLGVWTDTGLQRRLTVPPEVDRVRQIDWVLPTLAGLLAALALVAVGYALVTSVRHRRRELAVLKTLGFDRRQVRATVAWQATVLAVVGLVAGIPFGVLTGIYAWRVVADNLGVAAAASIPLVAILVAIPTAIVIVNLIAFFPARAAARARPAVALATE